jgi:hypothetical protein
MVTNLYHFITLVNGGSLSPSPCGEHAGSRLSSSEEPWVIVHATDAGITTS